ncbi:tRNA-dihydrouridine synthase family protein [Candidatus Saccharibacteria bacterium]|nr:tRNA-dihydrouridine synthase family protein [Candidatus Saccharibacteria bacterium]
MFWDQFKAPFSILAPMEGVTDLVFRQVVTKAGRPDIYFTEFTNSDSYASEAGRPNAMRRLEFLPSEQPIVPQIWGSKPESFAITSHGLKEMGYTAVDINTGCPEKNVVKTGGGSGLIKTPDLAAEIIQATKSSGLDVSVKCRLGFTKVEEYKTWIPHLLKQDVKALTVHLRTRKEMSIPPAHFELIPDLVRMRNEIAPETKLVINGDVTNSKMGLQMAEQYGFDGWMIGRGIFKNPFCFRNHEPTHEELVALLNYHLDIWEMHWLDGRESASLRAMPGELSAGQEDRQGPAVPPEKESVLRPGPVPFEPLKRFFKIYIHGVRGASDLRARLMECKDIAQVREILDKEEI